MEFYEELFLTAVISILLAFLIGKIAAVGADEVSDPVAARAASASVSSSSAAAGGEKGIELKDLGRSWEGLGSTPVETETAREPEPAPARAGDESRSCEVEVVDGGSKEGETEEGEKSAREGEDVVLEAAEQGLEEIPVKGTDREAAIVVGVAGFPDEEQSVDDVVEAHRVAEVVVRGVEEGKEVGESVGEELAEEKDVKAGSLLQGEDEWEGIERSELEKLFAVASGFVVSDKGAEAVARLSNETQMQLYGLHKSATEGPCYEPQPMALKVSSRAKWNAWQRLGNMNPEAAMEQYINLLNDNIPEWQGETSGEPLQNDAHSPPEVGESATEDHDSTSSLEKSEAERLHEDSSCIRSDIENIGAGPKLFNQGLTKTFLFNLLSPTRVSLLIFYS